LPDEGGRFTITPPSRTSNTRAPSTSTFESWMMPRTTRHGTVTVTLRATKNGVSACPGAARRTSSSETRPVNRFRPKRLAVRSSAQFLATVRTIQSRVHRVAGGVCTSTIAATTTASTPAAAQASQPGSLNLTISSYGRRRARNAADSGVHH
jgi:hypothetical protein